LRLLLARYPSELSKVMQIIHRAISTHVVNKVAFPAHLDKKYPTSKQTPLLPPLRAPPEERYANDFKIQRDFNFGA